MFSYSQSVIVTFYVVLGVSLMGEPSHAQSIDPNKLIRAAAANYKDNVLEVDKYEYVENDATLFNGSLVDTKVSDTYEIMVISGHPYRRHIGHDGQPLPPEEEEQERQNLAKAERRDSDDAVADAKVESAVSYGNQLPELPLKELLDNFKVRFKKTKMLDGRNAYIFSATPKEKPRSSNEIKNDPRNFEMEIWVDEKDKQIIKVEGEVIHRDVLSYPQYAKVSSDHLPNAVQVEQSLYGRPLIVKSGTKITADWKKVNEEAWLPSEMHIEGVYLVPASKTMPKSAKRLVANNTFEIPFGRVTIYDRYKKFRVEHRIFSGAH